MKTYHSQIQTVLIMTLVLNIVMMLIKPTIGMWTGALSLLADALHSVTDSLNNVLGLVTSHLSAPQPDRDHPYVHQKYEAIGALGIAAFLGVACFEILQTAIGRILSPKGHLDIEGPELWLFTHCARDQYCGGLLRALCGEKVAKPDPTSGCSTYDE